MAARRTIAPSQPKSANLTVEQMRRGTDRLKLRIVDLEAFDPQSVQQRWAAEVKTLETSIEETLAAVFGHHTVEYVTAELRDWIGDRSRRHPIGSLHGTAALAGDRRMSTFDDILLKANNSQSCC